MVLVCSPGRLSRKYTCQVPLAQELVLLKASSGATSKDQPPVQFQGMIPEYECAQIAEMSRLNVLSGAPYGYGEGLRLYVNFRTPPLLLPLHRF